MRISDQLKFLISFTNLDCIHKEKYQSIFKLNIIGKIQGSQMKVYDTKMLIIS